MSGNGAGTKVGEEECDGLPHSLRGLKYWRWLPHGGKGVYITENDLEASEAEAMCRAVEYLDSVDEAARLRYLGRLVEKYGGGA